MRLDALLGSLLRHLKRELQCLCRVQYNEFGLSVRIRDSIHTKGHYYQHFYCGIGWTSIRCGGRGTDAYCSERSWLPSEESTWYDGALKASCAACATSEASNGTTRNVKRAIIEDGKESGLYSVGVDEKRRHVEYLHPPRDRYP